MSTFSAHNLSRCRVPPRPAPPVKIQGRSCSSFSHNLSGCLPLPVASRPGEACPAATHKIREQARLNSAHKSMRKCVDYKHVADTQCHRWYFLPIQPIRCILSISVRPFHLRGRQVLKNSWRRPMLSVRRLKVMRIYTHHVPSAFCFAIVYFSLLPTCCYASLARAR